MEWRLRAAVDGDGGSGGGVAQWCAVVVDDDLQREMKMLVPTFFSFFYFPCSISLLCYVLVILVRV
ncbi:hypothetical protein L195_g062760 [Trifolium pratense]|uniref:Uncharacterized protein n=1 Tax=Trifolium pratense TaxID=57577 RepID=A0A2K3KHL6_TRIPR|nr:hypothetical protein L195_g062760 [Trifolium pratense]